MGIKLYNSVIKENHGGQQQRNEANRQEHEGRLAIYAPAMNRQLKKQQQQEKHSSKYKLEIWLIATDMQEVYRSEPFRLMDNLKDLK